VIPSATLDDHGILVAQALARADGLGDVPADSSTLAVQKLEDIEKAQDTACVDYGWIDIEKHVIQGGID
jgi:hypothetical protein